MGAVRQAHGHVGVWDSGIGLAADGVSSSRIALEEGVTGTGLPLTFMCTEALPSVSSSCGAVSVGMCSPTVNVRSSISLAPLPLTRQTYTVLVGTSWSVTFV